MEIHAENAEKPVDDVQLVGGVVDDIELVGGVGGPVHPPFSTNPNWHNFKQFISSLLVSFNQTQADIISGGLTKKYKYLVICDEKFGYNLSWPRDQMRLAEPDRNLHAPNIELVSVSQ